MNNPQTEAEAQQILRALEDINFVTIVVIVVVTGIVLQVIQRLFPWFAERLPARARFAVLHTGPILRLTIFVVAVFAITSLIVRPTAQNVIAIAGGLAVVLGFGLNSYISSIIGGMVAVYEQPYRPGDWITIDGDYGEVKSIGLRAIKVLTPYDTLVTIPHSKIWDTNIANANNGKRDHLCVANFYLKPTHDAEVAQRVLYDVALTSPYTQLKRPIQVIVIERPWGTHYELKAYPVDGRQEFPYISDLTVQGKAALMTLGIEFAEIPPAYVPKQQPIPNHRPYI